LIYRRYILKGDDKLVKGPDKRVNYIRKYRIRAERVGRLGVRSYNRTMLISLLRWLRFNLWYFHRPPWDTGVTPPELESFSRAHPAGKAIDLGCGTGTNLAYLARCGWQVVGVDFALRAVEIARRRLVWEQLRGEVRLGDVAKIESLGSGYDLVLDIGCLHGLSEAARRAYLSGLPGLLANGGTYLLYAHLQSPSPAREGLAEEEVRCLGQHLRQVTRQDSLDRFGRPAVWLEFVRVNG
jgi:SAM-dependent methyltransferase